MTVLDGVDPVLWQQAVEAAAKARWARGPWILTWDELPVGRQLIHLRDASADLTAALPVLQQATLHQLAALTNVGGAPYRATMWLDWAAAQFGVELHTDARPDRPLPGETPKEDAG